MKVMQTETAEAFLRLCEPHLLAQESLNCLPYGLADAMARRTRLFSAPLHFVVVDGDEVVGAGLRTDADRGLTLSCMPPRAAARLAEAAPAGLFGCVGEVSAARAFIEAYTAKHGRRASTLLQQGVYEARVVRMPPCDGFSLVPASEATRELAERFIQAFGDEALPHEATDAPAVAQRLIRSGGMFLLRSPQADLVATASTTRQTRNAASVSLVYTPPEYRRRGYGALVTALVSQHLLDGGKKACNLFTDLANPTSNKIYQAIGYQRLGEATSVKFE